MNDISVIIPTADRDDLLKRAVESVLNQTMRPKKVVIVDNGINPVGISFDDSIVELIRTAPRIGPSKPRNIGAGHCETEYLAFLDDDDWWKEDYLENTLLCFSKKNADVVVGKMERYDMSGKLISNKKEFPNNYHLQRALFYTNPGFGGINIAMKRAVFWEIGGFDEKLPSSVDRELGIRFLISGKSMVFEPKSVAFVQEHNAIRVSAHKNLVKSNLCIILKYWKYMTVKEKRLACLRYLKTLRRFLKSWIIR